MDMVVLGANLTMDRTMRLRRLLPGHVQRPDNVVVTPGGKAVNVCRASAALGHRPRLVANLPGATGAIVGDWLVAEGHDVIAVRTHGEIRAAHVLLESNGRVTVLNEPGPELGEADCDLLLEQFAAQAAGAGVAVGTGSVPPGAPADFYGRVVQLARDTGSTSIVDAAREHLEAALKFEPDIVTPNLGEAHGVLRGLVDETVEMGDPARLRTDASGAAAELVARGARSALVTVGRHGVGGADADGRFWIEAAHVEVVNPIGAGDSFVAGLAQGLSDGLPLREAAVLASAVGTASVTTALAGGFDVELVHDLWRTLRWEEQ